MNLEQSEVRLGKVFQCFGLQKPSLSLFSAVLLAHSAPYSGYQILPLLKYRQLLPFLVLQLSPSTLYCYLNVWFTYSICKSEFLHLYRIEYDLPIIIS